MAEGSTGGATTPPDDAALERAAIADLTRIARLAVTVSEEAVDRTYRQREESTRAFVRQDVMIWAQGQVLEHVLSDRDINGPGLGSREAPGRGTEELAVAVYVPRKHPAAHLFREHLLPAYVDIDGIPVRIDVIQDGPFTLQKTATARVLAEATPRRPGWRR